MLLVILMLDTLIATKPDPFVALVMPVKFKFDDPLLTNDVLFDEMNRPAALALVTLLDAKPVIVKRPVPLDVKFAFCEPVKITPRPAPAAVVPWMLMLPALLAKKLALPLEIHTPAAFALSRLLVALPIILSAPVVPLLTKLVFCVPAICTATPAPAAVVPSNVKLPVPLSTKLLLTVDSSKPVAFDPTKLLVAPPLIVIEPEPLVVKLAFCDPVIMTPCPAPAAVVPEILRLPDPLVIKLALPLETKTPAAFDVAEELVATPRMFKVPEPLAVKLVF